jgi:hypothetical protein
MNPLKVGNKCFKDSFYVHLTDYDLPSQPCGACNEWLKKIAEVNPQLQVITFTDAHCNGIYVEPVNEY